MTSRFLRRELLEALLREVKRMLVEFKEAGVADRAIYSELSPLASAIMRS